MDIDRYISFEVKWYVLLWDTFLLSFVGVGLLWVNRLLIHYAPDFVVNSPENIRVIFFILYLIVAFILVNGLVQQLFSFRKRCKIYKFSSRSWPSEWMFNGGPEIQNSSDLLVKSTRAGCLLKKYLWKDFRMTFELIFPSTEPNKIIGIVFRATDLDNYFMLQLRPEDGKIIPHVRYRGGWDIFEPIPQPKLNKEKESYNITFNLSGELVSLQLDDQLAFSWVLPTHVDVNFRESGVEGNAKELSESGNGRKVSTHVQEIPFRLKHGMVGFRAHHGGEKAIVRNLKIESL